MEDDLLTLSRRREIYNHIQKFPGTYLREMESALELSIGDLQYHLGQLERGGLVSIHDDGRRKGYFANDQVKFLDRKMLAVVRLETPRRIVLFLLEHPDSGFKEILAQFNFTKGALSFHLKRLLKAGIILKGKKEKENIYKIADEEHVIRVLTTYKSSIADELADNLIDVLTRM